MDTRIEPIWAEYHRSRRDDGSTQHIVASSEGIFTLELLRQVLGAYDSLSWSDKRKVNKVLRFARKTGTPIDE